MEALERLLRGTPERLAEWVLLGLHMSLLPPLGAKPHQTLIAAALLEEAGRRGDGQMFRLPNGNLALLFKPTDGGAAAISMLESLFQPYTADPSGLVTLSHLGSAGREALTFIQTCLQEPVRPLPTEPVQASAAAIAAMETVIQTAALPDLVHRQTAVAMMQGPQMRIVRLYREVAISTAVLEARIAAVGQANADPFLFNHLASRLDQRMLDALRRDVPERGLLSGALGRAALHVNLTLAGVLSSAFAAFASACRPGIAAGLEIGIEIQFVEAFADAKAFVLARERLRLANMRLVLEGVSGQALILTSPAALQPDLVKLTWSPSLTNPDTALRAAIGRVGLDRLVLHRSESEAAIAWGLSVGLTRFQGRYVDAMLAAERLRTCDHRAACTARQCMERASATGPAGRSACRNPLLLDHAAPEDRTDIGARAWE